MSTQKSNIVKSERFFLGKDWLTVEVVKPLEENLVGILLEDDTGEVWHKRCVYPAGEKTPEQVIGEYLNAVTLAIKDMGNDTLSTVSAFIESQQEQAYKRAGDKINE